MIGSLKEGEWYDCPINEIYCNGVLVKRLNDSEVVIAPRWTVNSTQKEKTIIFLEEKPGENEFWYDIVHEDSLMLAEEYADCVWLEMSVNLVLDLWFTLNDIRVNEGVPERLAYVIKQVVTSDYEDYITKQEIEELGFVESIQSNLVYFEGEVQMRDRSTVLGDLKNKTWYAFPQEHGYSDGILVKRFGIKTNSNSSF